MFNYVIIAGLNDKDSKQQEITTDAARAIIVLKYAGGATLTDCRGIYTHDDGQIVFETSIKIEVGGIDEENALQIAADVKAALNQESIYFSKFAASVDFI